MSNLFKYLFPVTIIGFGGVASGSTRYCYLAEPAGSVADLVAEVRANPSAAMGYGRHFGMDSEKIAGYFGTLSYSHMPEKAMIAVYTSADLDAKPTLAVLEPGDGIFKDRLGRPVLRASDAAPIAQPSSAVPAASRVTASATSPEVETSPPSSSAAASSTTSFAQAGAAGVGSGVGIGALGILDIASGVFMAFDRDRNVGPQPTGPMPNSTPEPNPTLLLIPAAGVAIIRRRRR